LIKDIKKETKNDKSKSFKQKTKNDKSKSFKQKKYLKMAKANVFCKLSRICKDRTHAFIRDNLQKTFAFAISCFFFYVPHNDKSTNYFQNK